MIERRNEAGMPRHGTQPNTRRIMQALCCVPALHGDGHTIESYPWKLYAGPPAGHRREEALASTTRPWNFSLALLRYRLKD
jgi:hypothetical protein